MLDLKPTTSRPCVLCVSPELSLLVTASASHARPTSLRLRLVPLNVTCASVVTRQTRPVLHACSVQLDLPLPTPACASSALLELLPLRQDYVSASSVVLAWKRTPLPLTHPNITSTAVFVTPQHSRQETESASVALKARSPPLMVQPNAKVVAVASKPTVFKQVASFATKDSSAPLTGTARSALPEPSATLMARALVMSAQLATRLLLTTSFATNALLAPSLQMDNSANHASLVVLHLISVLASARRAQLATEIPLIQAVVPLAPLETALALGKFVLLAHPARSVPLAGLAHHAQSDLAILTTLVPRPFVAPVLPEPQASSEGSASDARKAKSPDQLDSVSLAALATSPTLSSRHASSVLREPFPTTVALAFRASQAQLPPAPERTSASLAHQDSRPTSTTQPVSRVLQDSAASVVVLALSANPARQPAPVACVRTARLVMAIQPQPPALACRVLSVSVVKKAASVLSAPLARKPSRVALAKTAQPDSVLLSVGSAELARLANPASAEALVSTVPQESSPSVEASALAALLGSARLEVPKLASPARLARPVLRVANAYRGALLGRRTRASSLCVPRALQALSPALVTSRARGALTTSTPLRVLPPVSRTERSVVTCV